MLSTVFAALILLVTGPDNTRVLSERLYYSATAKFLRTLEFRLYDQKFKLRGQRPPPSEVVIVALDEKSISQFGRWPWPRTLMADLVRKLEALGPKAVVFDIAFTEEDQLGVYGLMNRVVERLENIPKLNAADEKLPPEWQKTLQEQSNSLRQYEAFVREEREKVNADRELGKAVRDAGNVVLGYFFLTEDEVLGLKPESYQNTKTLASSVISTFVGENAEASKKRFTSGNYGYVGVKTNIPSIIGENGENGQQGFFNTAADDEDGIFRRALLLLPMNGEIYPSLPLQGVQMFYRSEGGATGNIIPFFDPYSIGEVRQIGFNAPHQLQTDRLGRIHYNWYGDKGSIPTYSIASVASGDLLPENVKGKLVFVGPTALAIADLRTTPYGANFPGVEMQATIAANIIQNEYITRGDRLFLTEVFLMLVVGVLLGVAIGRMRPLPGFFLTVSVIIGVAAFDYYVVFLKWHVWMKTVFPLVGLLSVYIAVTLRGFIAEEIERRKVKNAFNAYVNPTVVDQMLDHPDKFRLGGERKEMTVFFSDIRGFTTMSEAMEPEELVMFLNEYLTPMTDIVLGYDGTVDKYIGDAMMGFWGAPLQQPDHAERACNAALDMIAKLQDLKRDWEKRNLPLINVGIGVNSGQMSVGNMGSKSRFSYTVMGDEVNLASRIEGLCKEYGCNIIVGSKTARKVQRQFLMRKLDRVRVKGKALGEDIFELIGRIADADADAKKTLIETYEKGLEMFWARQWSQAQAYFKQVLEMKPGDRSSEIFLEQIVAFEKDAPSESWDGIRTMAHK